MLDLSMYSEGRAAVFDRMKKGLNPPLNPIINLESDGELTASSCPSWHMGAESTSGMLLGFFIGISCNIFREKVSSIINSNQLSSL